MINVITEVLPKTVKGFLLKAQINMQVLIGNVFGFKFKSLDSNIDKLNNLYSPPKS